MNQRPLWPALGLNVLMTITVALIWAFAAGYVAITWNERGTYTNENLVVGVHGEPMIDSYIVADGRREPLAQKTLDGKEVFGNLNSLRGADVYSPPLMRHWSDGPATWEERIARMDLGNVRWVVIHDGKTEGRAYIAAYNLESKQPTGYIGRQGFRLFIPPVSEHFEVGGPFNYGSHNIEGSGLSIRSVRRFFPDYHNSAATPPSCIYLLDGDKLVEVDVDERSVRTLIEADVQTIEIVERPVKVDETAAPKVNDSGWIWQAPSKREELLLLAKLRDSIAILNPAADKRDDFKLPTPLQTGMMDVYSISSESLLIRELRNRAGAVNDHAPEKHSLTWLNNAGEVTREVDVEVAGNGKGVGALQEATIAAIAGPHLVFLGLVTFWFAPALQMSIRNAASYTDAVLAGLEMMWPVALVVIALSLLAAWIVVRWQRAYGRPHTIAWAIAAFVFGPLGVVAYAIQFGFPRRVPCPACGKLTLQRRGECMACRQPFPAPTLTGLEVFA